MNNKLFEGNITKLIFKLSIPMILAQLVNLLYNMVDRMFIGHIPEVGDIAIGGVGACFPIILFISAFSAIFGMGGAPHAAIKLGKGDIDGAEKTLNTSFLMLVGISCVIIPVMLIFKEPILTAFGANETNLPFALDYIKIYIIGTPLVMLSLGLNQYIICQGKSLFAMVSVVIGALMNIALDALLIKVFGMGVAGAALATIISQGCSALFIIIFLLSKKSIIKIRPFKHKFEAPIVKSIMLLGLSPFIMQSTEALVQIVFNNQIKTYVTDLSEQTLYLSAMSLLISLMSLINMPMQGLAQGSQTLISQNYGGGYIDRAKKASRQLIFFSLTYSFVFVAILLLFPSPFVKIFNDDPKLVELCTKLIRIFFIGMAFMGIQIGCQNSFLALGKSKISLILALLRKVILLIPLAFILPLFFNRTGIYLAECTADILAITITLVCYLLLFNKYLKEGKPKPKDDDNSNDKPNKKKQQKKFIYKKGKEPVIKTV